MRELFDIMNLRVNAMKAEIANHGGAGQSPEATEFYKAYNTWRKFVVNKGTLAKDLGQNYAEYDSECISSYERLTYWYIMWSRKYGIGKGRDNKFVSFTYALDDRKD